MAADFCLQQCATALARIGSAEPLVVAYEPVWAIGARERAPAPYMIAVIRHMRLTLALRSGHCRIIYGGAAGRGSLGELWPTADGLFLGRYAHDPDNFGRVLREVEDLLSDWSTDRATLD